MVRRAVTEEDKWIYPLESDWEIYPNVFVSRYWYYNERRGPRTRKICEWVGAALPILRDLLTLPPSMAVRIGPIDNPNWNGYYVHKSRMIWLNTCLDQDYLATLCHEAIHASQYHRGRCRIQDMVGAEGFIWKENASATEEVFFHLNDCYGDYAKYRALPWEKEAWGLQDVMAEAVRKIADDPGMGKFCATFSFSTREEWLSAVLKAYEEIATGKHNWNSADLNELLASNPVK